MAVGNDNNVAVDKAKTEQVSAPKEKSKLEKILHRADTWKSRIKKFSNKEVADSRGTEQHHPQGRARKHHGEGQSECQDQDVCAV